MTIKCVAVPFKNISIITHQHQMSNKLLSKVYFCNELTQIYFPYFSSYETSHMVEEKVAKNMYNLFNLPGYTITCWEVRRLIVNKCLRWSQFKDFFIEELTIKNLPLLWWLSMTKLHIIGTYHDNVCILMTS